MTPPNKRKKTDDDPERLRLEKAQAAASPTIFLPNSNSNGVGKFQIDNRNENSLKGLFYLVVSKVQSGGVTWGEGQDDDPRRRMYGFLPQKRDALLDEGIQIQKYGADGIQEHEDALKLASVDLVFANQYSEHINPSVLLLDESIHAALKAVTQQVQGLVLPQYKKYATMDQLIAVQPNLHKGANYLPAHLDFPRHDGFGVLIVTIGIRGSGVIVLIDEGEEDAEAKSWSFSLHEGEAYILCGDARNKCVHGVLCNDNDNSSHQSQRETLNLRYGLHSSKFAYEEIDQYWPD